MPAGAGKDGPKNAAGKPAAKPAAAMGLGKVQGLTRPGSKITVPVNSDSSDSASAKQAKAAQKDKMLDKSAPSAEDPANDDLEGQVLVGKKVKKLFGRHGFFDGEVTHYVAASDTYRVRSSHA